MKQSIQLFNPNDKPWGKLSNNYRYPLDIDGKQYSTVTNYIFSNMLIQSSHRQILRTVEIKETSKVNNELLKALDFLEKPEGVSLGSSLMTLEEKEKVLLLHKMSKIPTEYLRIWNSQNINKSLKNLNLLKKYSPKNYDEIVRRAREKYLQNKNLPQFFKNISSTLPIKIQRTGVVGSPTDEKDILRSWNLYADTGALKKKEKARVETNKYQKYLSQQLHKPFNSINLRELRQKIILESELNQMGIYRLFEQKKYEEVYNTLNNACDIGFNALMVNGPQPQILQNLLESTQNVLLYYNSPDPFLGVGLDGKGANLVGKSLMQIRHNYRLSSFEKKKQAEINKRNKHIYNIYIAYFILRKDLEENNDTLKKYFGKTPEQIIKEGSKLNVGIPDENTIVKLYYEDKLNSIIMTEIHNPGTLVLNIRRKGLEDLRSKLEKEKRDIIFEYYLKYMIKRNFEEILNKKIEIFKKNGGTNLDHKEIEERILDKTVSRELEKLSPTEKQKLQSRIVDLFKMGMLSGSLSDSIDNKLNTIGTIPSMEDIEQAKIATIAPLVQEEKGTIPQDTGGTKEDSSSSSIEKSKYGTKKMIKSILGKDEPNLVDKDFPEDKKLAQATFIYQPPKGSSIKISLEENNPFRVFDPDYRSNYVINIQRNYPTVKHYILTRLIANTGVRNHMEKNGQVTLLPGMGISEAYKNILKSVESRGISVTPLGQQNGTNVIQINVPEVPGSEEKKIPIRTPVTWRPKNTVDFLNLTKIVEKYEKIRDDTDKKLLGLFSTTAINKKFENKSLQDLLMLTGSDTLEWMDPFSIYLGKGRGEKQGFNYVGKILMSLREQLKLNRKEEEVISINPPEMLQFIKKDIFIQDWIKMRMKDMCFIISLFQSYLKERYDYDYDLEEGESLKKLIKFILSNIYFPCNILIDNYDNINFPIPSIGLRIIQKCKIGKSNSLSVYVQDVEGKEILNKEMQRKKSIIGKKKQEAWQEFLNGKQPLKIRPSQQEISQFKEKQRKEFEEFRKNLNVDDPVVNSMSLQIFEDQQENQLEIFLKGYAKKKPIRTPEENELNKQGKLSRSKEGLEAFNKYKIIEARLNNEWKQTLYNEKKIQSHYNMLIREIGQMLWDRIAVMLTELIKFSNIPNPFSPDSGTSADSGTIKKTLLNMGKMSSQKVKCIKIIENEEDNCITSAILNLLNGIKKFKIAFCPKPHHLEKDDVNLATSIILELPLKIEEKNYNNYEDIESDDEGGNSTDSDQEEEIKDEYLTLKDDQFPGEQEDDFEEFPSEGGESEDQNPLYSFGNKNNKYLSRIELQLDHFNDYNNKIIAEEILDSVNVIRQHKMNSGIKQNRINFFATKI